MDFIFCLLDVNDTIEVSKFSFHAKNVFSHINHQNEAGFELSRFIIARNIFKRIDFIHRVAERLLVYHQVKES